MAPSAINTKLPLSIYSGESKNFALTVLDEDCDPVDLTGHVIYFTVKRDACDVLDEETLIYKDSTDVNDIEINADQALNKGQALIKIVAADIDGITPQSYVYDVFLEAPAGTRRLISGVATFFIQQPVTVKFSAPVVP